MVAKKVRMLSTISHGHEEFIRFRPNPGFRVFVPFSKKKMIHWSKHRGLKIVRL